MGWKGVLTGRENLSPKNTYGVLVQKESVEGMVLDIPDDLVEEIVASMDLSLVGKFFPFTLILKWCGSGCLIAGSSKAVSLS